ETQYITTSILTVANGGFDNPDDAYSADLNIGFNFVFGGVTYTKCKMSSNGVLFFSGATAAYSNTQLSSMLSSIGVYALWEDLYVGTQSDETLSRALYYTAGPVGSRVFIMQWSNWYSYAEPYEVGTFNVVLYEGSNKIDIYYRNMLGTSTQREYGNSATIGIVATSSYYSQYSYDAQNAPEGKLLTYTPSTGGNTPYTLTQQMVTPATTAAIQTYFLAFTTSPQIPVNLSAATTSGSTSATLTWDLGSLGQTPTAYKIRYALNAQMSGMTETTECSSPGRSYTLTGLTSGATYYWEVVSTIGSLSSVSTISTFQMVANTPPVASNGSFTTSQNTPYSGYLTANDVNNTANTSGLIYSVVTAPSSGTAVINNSATGAFTYTPNTNFSGPDSFTFKAFDGAAYSAAATISITVAAVLNPPLIASQPTNMTVVSG